MPQKPHARRKQKQRRRRKLAEWRLKKDQQEGQDAAASKNKKPNAD